ncbi:hypothetical protein [Emticicia sp. BO119]|uniref:hypothetical protein n=1 Tax=Emticicia sp. BO119 TaxID=2757768 RepID=UPI0015F00099|nr:hypothetical protein [Emticicia sp. BO119]MBA4853660.1 hypothetical protein [Emticicia sp. BO119]
MKLNLKHTLVYLCLGTLLLTTSSCSFAQLDTVTPSNIISAGNCLETRFTFSRQGRIEQSFVKNYDSQGRLLSETKNYSSQFSGNYKESYTYEYDAKGNNTKITYSHNDVVKKVTTKEYSLLGKLTQEVISADGVSNAIQKTLFTESGSVQIFYDKDGVTETIREIIGLDPNGQVITKEVVSSNGVVAFSDKYTYALLGKVGRWVHYDAADKVTTITNYEYNPAGNLTKETTTRNDVLYASTINTYNANGKLEKSTRLNGKNQVDYYFTYEHNSKGLMVKENYFYNNQILSTRGFEYDAKGNTVKELFSDAKGVTTSLKEWEYFCK